MYRRKSATVTWKKLSVFYEIQIVAGLLFVKFELGARYYIHKGIRGGGYDSSQFDGLSMTFPTLFTGGAAYSIHTLKPLLN